MQRAIQDLPSRFGYTIRVLPSRKGGCFALVLQQDSSGAAPFYYPFVYSTLLAFTTSKKNSPALKIQPFAPLSLQEFLGYYGFS
jgi:hypothetical protein